MPRVRMILCVCVRAMWCAEDAMGQALAEKVGANVAPACARSTVGPPTREREYWRLHELEDVVPRVDAIVACPEKEVLEGRRRRMENFAETMEKFDGDGAGGILPGKYECEMASAKTNIEITN